MADNKSKAANTEAEDVLPIKKTNPAVFVVGGVVLLAALGFAFGSSGGDAESAKQKVEASEKESAPAKGMTKAELEARKAHLKATQKAFAAVAADDAAEAKKKKATTPPAQTTTASNASPAKAKSTSKRAPAKKKRSAAQNKKTMNSLDGFGADIASALK